MPMNSETLRAIYRDFRTIEMNCELLYKFHSIRSDPVEAPGPATGQRDATVP